MENWILLHWIALPAGSWADWFSGSMSALAVSVALASFWIAEARAKRLALETDKDTARAIGLKVMRVFNQSDDIRRHFEKFARSRIGAQPQIELDWRTFPPMVGFTDDRTLALTQSESVLLVKLGETDFLTSLMITISRYEAVVASMKEYKDKCEVVFAMLPAPVSADGATFTHAMTAQDAAKLAPYDLMLNSLLQATGAMVDENVANASTLAVQYAPMMKRRFRAEKWLSISPKEGGGQQPPPKSNP